MPLHLSEGERAGGGARARGAFCPRVPDTTEMWGRPGVRGGWGTPVAGLLVVLLIFGLSATIGPLASRDAAAHGAPGRLPSTVPARVVGSAAYTEVQFNLSGLRSGTNWTIVLGGTSETGYGSKAIFEKTRGTYSFSVGAHGYTATPNSGTLNVSGQLFLNVTVTFHILWPGPYTVTFTAFGLPSGTDWTVVFNGVSNESDQPSITCGGLPPGTYSYHVESVGDLSPAPSAGNVTLVALNATVDVRFAAPSPGTPHLGPWPLTWEWGFAIFAFALWVIWLGYNIARGIGDYLWNAAPGPSPKHRRSLNSLKLAGHVGVLVIEGLGGIAIALDPQTVSLGPIAYGVLLLIVLVIFVLRDVGGFATHTGYGVYVDWKPPPPSPCWRCGLLNPADAATCAQCGASLQG